MGWSALKASGKPPFGQLPILEVDGQVVAHSAPIGNVIGKLAGPALEGATTADYAMSQMLLVESEDVYNMLQKNQPTKFVSKKGTPEEYDQFWAKTMPAEMAKLEAMLKGEGSFFTSGGSTVGELFLFSMLHQMK